MNLLEELINGIYKRHLRKKERKEEREKVELEKQERDEKIYNAVSDFIKSDKCDIKKLNSCGESKFNIGEMKISVRVSDYGKARFDYQAAVYVNSVGLDASELLNRQLAAEIRELVKKNDEEENERIINEAVEVLEKKS